MKQICSNDHFKRLLKSFEKITYRVANDYVNYYFTQSDSNFNTILGKLLKNFKSNPFKTKSCLTYINFDYDKFYVSYTFEDEFGKRSKQPKYIIFRVFAKYSKENYNGYYRKKRLVRWIIPITWQYLNN